MAYDFSNIKTIIRNGTELSKITNSAGAVIWQKLYIWKKYNSTQQITGYTSSTSTTTLSTYPSGNLYSGLSFNSSTGEYTLSGVATSYMGYTSFGLCSAGFQAICQQEIVDKGYVYFLNNKDNYYYKLTGNCQLPMNVIKYTPTAKYSYVQGSTSYGTVTSTNPNAYPTNGRHTDGYWYVKQ